MQALLGRLRSYIQPWFANPSTEINQRRCEILRDCLLRGEEPRGLYTLTVPTGGGKTISSLAFALTHSAKNKMDRVIYVIPYTSIIEQNAKVFREILGDENVIEHHSGVQIDENQDMEGNESLRRKMLATENWDAPVIVTTAVQFFDSLFSNKPSKCRKLHNIADSVIIFDEAQMIPLAYLKPCVCAIGELVRHYHVTAVLCTATQPSLNRIFSEYDKNLSVREICHDVAALQTFFRRVHFEDAGKMDLDRVAAAMARQNQVLCIVNKKISAQQLFQKLPREGSYHLSTWMTPDHRTKVLKAIRERLKNGLPCRVVSTNLMEAGVDVDFPQVWREKAGLDSILQAAGRCNREGKHSAEESKVVLFTLEGGVPKYMRPNLEAANIALEEAAYPDESSSIESYFNQLYRLRTEDAMDTKKILEKCNDYEFETIAKYFHLIDSDTYTIYIPTDYNAADLKAFEERKCSRALMRRLGRSAVNVQWWDWDKLDKAKKLDRLDEYSALLRDPKNDYNEQFGLKLDVVTGLGIMEE